MSLPNAPAVNGAPRLILLAEGLAVLFAATFAYWMTEGSWLLFAVLFFAPDLFMVGYIAGNRIGAVVYNLGHTYVVALGLVLVGSYLALPVLTGIGLIWCAHIGADRMLGFGLKYTDGFGATHLTRPVAR